jgi:hypothetical protein
VLQRQHRYADCGNGTVTDSVTGLTWLKDAACLGSAHWAAANQAAAALASGQCGLTDRSSPGQRSSRSIFEIGSTPRCTM